ncbi:MAG: sigma-E factor negative regulatory protein [Woeseia sp.]
MNDALRMQISAFVDGELPENETELLMRRLSQDRALRDLVADYLRIGRLLRRDREVPGIDGLRGRIQAALGEQPVAAEAEAPVRVNRLLRPVAGLAVACVVAAVAILGVRQVVAPPAGGQTAALQSAPEASLAANPGYTQPQPEEVLNNRPSEMLIQYYLSHGATSRDLGANGILTRLVTLELREAELVGVDPAASVPVDESGDAATEAQSGAKQDPPESER